MEKRDSECEKNTARRADEGKRVYSEAQRWRAKIFVSNEGKGALEKRRS